MSNIDTIKSYLVQLGVDVDSRELAKWDNALNKMDSSFMGLSKRLGSSLVKITGLFAGATLAGAKFAESVARTDMEMQKLSKRMWMSTDSAKALKNIMDAMDESDLQDIALNPELTRNFMELRELAKTLKTPTAVKNALKDIRDIGHELNKSQLIFKYFKEQLTGALYARFSKSLQKFREWLKYVNDKWAKNIVNYADKISTVIVHIYKLFGRFIDLAKTLWTQGLKPIIDGVTDLFKKLPNWGKALVALAGTIGVAIMAGPLGKILTVFSGAMLLWDDYKTYQEGGTSALPKVWDFVGKALDSLSDLSEYLGEAIYKLIRTINMWVLKVGLLAAEFKEAVLPGSQREGIDKALNAIYREFGSSAIPQEYRENFMASRRKAFKLDLPAYTPMSKPLDRGFTPMPASNGQVTPIGSVNIYVDGAKPGVADDIINRISSIRSSGRFAY